MKVAILTHPLGTNYGGMLQNYALQTVLRRLGHTPETLHYYLPISAKIKVLSLCGRILKKLKGQDVPLRGWPTREEEAVICQNSHAFIRDNINTTELVPLSEIKTFRKIGYEAFVVGSDQVWRGDRGYTHQFFLSDFKDCNVPKIAYAASMGVDWWSFNERDTKECKELIKDFKAVSVREESAITLCKEYLDVDALLVLDPTLLLSSEDYKSLISKTTIQSNNQKYMMVYVLDKSSEKKSIIEAASRKLNLIPFEVMAKNYFGEVGKNGLQSCILPKVEDWIQGFANADYVVTDSFHGTVFSIIFNKQFVAIANHERGAGRFLSLLRMLGLEDRLVESEEDAAALLTKTIDYSNVNEILASKKEESISFLKKNLV